MLKGIEEKKASFSLKVIISTRLRLQCGSISQQRKIPRQTFIKKIMTDPIFVDTLDSALTAFQRIRLERKIAVDLEGIDLSRDGKLCIAQVGLTSDPEIVFIFDVIALGRDLFTHGLKEILESAAIIKLVYDIRCDSDALFHQFGVTPKPVFDVQVSSSLQWQRSKKLIDL